MFSWERFERKGNEYNLFKEPCFHEEEYMNNIFYELKGNAKFDIHGKPEETTAVMTLIAKQLNLMDRYKENLTNQNSISNKNVFFLQLKSDIILSNFNEMSQNE